MALDKIFLINKNYLKRLFSLFILIPIYIFSIFSNSILSFVIILLTSIVLSFEWFNITQKNIDNNKKYLFIIITSLNIIIANYVNFTFSILITILLSSLFFFKFIFSNKDIYKVKWLFYGFIYISIPLIIFFHTKKIDDGYLILLWMFIIVCASDVFSYIFGNLLKGPKIFPVLSPSKTYSGTIAGLCIGSFCGIFFFESFITINSKYFIFYSILVSIAGLLGDLTISRVKRIFKIKDSSKLIPGHGGFLDRFDSISFGLLAVFFIQYLFN